MNPTDLIDRESLRDDVPEFSPGDNLKVHVRVVEGNRERIQVFQGNVIRLQGSGGNPDRIRGFQGNVIRREGSGVRETFTVRKLSFGVGVERTFPVHSPIIERIEVAARGDVRRAKLYSLRGRVGRAARVRERRFDPRAAADAAAELEAMNAEEAAM